MGEGLCGEDDASNLSGTEQSEMSRFPGRFWTNWLPKLTQASMNSAETDKTK